MAEFLLRADSKRNSNIYRDAMGKIWIPIKKILMYRPCTSIFQFHRTESRVRLNVIYWFLKKFNMLLLSMRLTYCCEINFMSPFHLPARGNNLIRKRPKWTTSSHQLRKYTKIYQNNFPKSTSTIPH